MVKVAILTMFKNEASIIYEWCRYHLDLGFDHIYMINNESSDCYQKAIQDLNSTKITIYKHAGSSVQIPAIQKFYKLIRNKYDWVYLCDIDEFLYFNDPNITVQNFLKSHDKKVHAIKVQWKIFIPIDFNQPVSLLENNTIANIHNKVFKYQDGKSFVKTLISPDDIINPHHPDINSKNIKKYTPNQKIVQINHYRYQSWEYMLGIKLSRGGGKSGPKRWSVEKKGLKLELSLKKNIENNVLKNRCAKLITHLYDKEQTKPDVSIYNNQYYHKIKNNIENKKINIGDDIESILKRNKKIIDWLKQ